jgi:hypothetical protein
MIETEQLELGEIDRYNKKCGGIYVWLYKPKTLDAEKLPKLRTLFGSFELSLKAKSKLYRFKDEIEGSLERKPVHENLSFDDDEIEFIRVFTVNHGIPMYIGRTKCFKTRLQRHLDCYQEEINASIISSLKNNSDDIPLDESDIQDTPVESSVFGTRLAKYNSGKWIKFDDISISLYKFANDDVDAVKKCEYFLNRLYRPILGNV